VAVLNRIKPLLCGLLTFFWLAACGAEPNKPSSKITPFTTPTVEQTESPIITFVYLEGTVSITYPAEWIEERYKNPSHLDMVEKDNHMDICYISAAGLALNDQIYADVQISDEEFEELNNRIALETIRVTSILAVATDEVDSNDGMQELNEIFTVCELLAQADGYDYYFFYNDEYDLQNLPEPEKDVFRQLTDKLTVLRDGIEILPRTATNPDIKNIDTQTLDGEQFYTNYFSNSPLIMVIIWSTTSQESLDLLSSLSKLAEQLPENVAMLGVVTDVSNVSEAKNAEILVENAELYCPMLINNNTLLPLTQKAAAFPTLIFIDRNGIQIGDVAVPSSTSVNDLLLLVNDYIGLMSFG